MQIKSVAKILFLIVLIPLIFINKIYAVQQLFTLKLFTEIQNPSSKEFNLILEADSTISTERARIEWSLPPNLISEEELIQDVDLNKGKNRYYLKVKPIAKVNGTLKVSLASYGSEKRYLSAQQAKIVTNSDRDLRPITNEYEKLKNITSLRNLFNILVLFTSLILIFLILFQKINEKINPQKATPKTPRNSRILNEFVKYKMKQKK
ncbi:hypothetical protein GF362_07130 [Candidatus Dojkabacteria bacterium]|nr:hypothetical protein [Candidatus Dojkabacteria bacterium]